MRHHSRLGPQSTWLSNGPAALHTSVVLRITEKSLMPNTALTQWDLGLLVGGAAPTTQTETNSRFCSKSLRNSQQSCAGTKVYTES